MRKFTTMAILMQILSATLLVNAYSNEILATSPASTSILAQNDWPMFRHDLYHTGYSTSAAPDENTTTWSVTKGAPIRSSPAVADGRVYIGANDKKLYCLNASTGASLWDFKTGGKVVSSPAIVEGRVYVGSDDKNLYCLNALTGKRIWKNRLGATIQSSPAVADGKIYIGTEDNALNCLDVSGSQIWSFTSGGMVASSPAFVEGRVYFGSDDSKLYCLNASSGVHLWNFTTGNMVESSPAVVPALVFFGSDDGNLYALDAYTGASLWSYTTGAAVVSSPAVAPGRVYFGSDDGKVYCLDANTGEYLWSFTTGGAAWSSPAVADGKVYVGSVDNKVYCLDALSGSQIWSFTTGGIVGSSPAVAYGAVYVGSDDGQVYAFGSYSVDIEAYCYAEDSSVSVGIAMDGAPTGYATPHTFTGLTGFHTFTVPELDPNGDGFMEWSTGETSRTITVNQGGTHTAYYQKAYTLTITTTVGGTTNPPPGTHTYVAGILATVTALPDADAVFDHWILDGSWEYSNPINILMSINHDLQAVFKTQRERMDILRFTVIKSPDAQLIGMQTQVTDAVPDLIRTADLEKLDADGCLIMQDLGFHVGFIGWNLRADQNYRRPGIPYWPLKDVEFRHALIHAYDQLGIIPPIYGYIVTPVRSLVPPAQSKYYNPAVPEHPYNPGDPFTSPAGEHSTCGILKAAGYTFNDAGTTGVVDDADFWRCPDNSPIPHIDIYTPLMEVAPTSYQHAAEYVSDLAQIGLASTSANGGQGLLNLGWDFNEYLDNVYYGAFFDAYMVFYSLGKLPSQLYSLLHTSQDCENYPGRMNAAGINDPTIDALVEAVKFSLDTDDIETAAKEAQRMLYTTTETGADNFALAYMTLYSRSYFNAYSPNLRGIVKSPGYGSNNKWTFLNAHWLPGTERIEGGKSVAVWTLGDEPNDFNPLYASTEDEREILDQSHDGLAFVNPYNHYDIPWLASDWAITETVTGMEIDFTLKNGVKWQDGHDFDAYDVEFCLEFIRDYQVPGYAETWETLVDVVITDATHLTIITNKAGLDLFYDFANLAALLPPQVWDGRFGDPSDPVVRQAVLDYDPTEAYNVAPGYTPGPTPTPTNLLGTGPWIFQFYDAVNMYCDLWQNGGYFMAHTEFRYLLQEMFWEVGDYNRDGTVNTLDITVVSLLYGYKIGDPEYDPNADFNSDGIIDTRDIRMCAFHLLWQMEYP